MTFNSPTHRHLSGKQCRLVLDRRWGFQEVQAPRFQDKTRQEKTSFKHPTSLPSGYIPGTDLCERFSRKRPEELCRWKIPVTPSGIEHATFRFVVQSTPSCAPRIWISRQNSSSSVCTWTMGADTNDSTESFREFNVLLICCRTKTRIISVLL